MKFDKTILWIQERDYWHFIPGLLVSVFNKEDIMAHLEKYVTKHQW